MLPPWKVGLTGGIGSGKSIIAGLFTKIGVPVIDADVISRELTSTPGPVLQRISAAFGDSILDRGGLLDRAALRTLVFTDASARHTLESILHPLVYDRMESIYSQIESPYCILSIPLLLETDASEKVDRILVVDCPVHMQIERTYNRDKVSIEIIESVIRSQVSRESRLAAADDIIVNDGSIADLKSRVDELHAVYLQLSKNRL